MELQAFKTCLTVSRVEVMLSTKDLRSSSPHQAYKDPKSSPGICHASNPGYHLPHVLLPFTQSADAIYICKPPHLHIRKQCNKGNALLKETDVDYNSMGSTRRSGHRDTSVVWKNIKILLD